MNPRAADGHPSLRMAVAAFTAMALVYFFSYFQRAAVPGTIFNELQTDLGLSATAVAALGSMFTWIYGGMQIVVGLLADRYGGARTLIGGGLIMAAGSLWFPLAHSTTPLFIARALTGCGASFMYLSMVKESDRLFDARHFTGVLGILLCVGYIGGMASTLPFERTVAAFGWRHCLLAVGVLTCAALVVAGLVLRRLGREPEGRRQPVLSVLGEVLGNRAIRPLLASGLIAFPMIFIMQTVLGKKFLQDFGGLSSPAAAMAVLIMAATSAMSVIVGGFLPRWMDGRRKPCMMAGATLMTLAVFTLMTGTLTHAPAWVFWIGYMLLAAGGMNFPGGTATIKELSRPGTAAAGIAVMNGLTYFGCGTIGQAGGLILDRYRDHAVVSDTGLIYPQEAYVTVFAFLAILAMMNLVFVWFVPETRGCTRPTPRPIEKEKTDETCL